MKRSVFGEKITALLLTAAVILSASFSYTVKAEIPTEHYTSSYSAIAKTKEKIHEIFPESYWEALDALLEEHPNWKFQAFYTGLTWAECFDGTFTELGTETVDGKKTGVSELYPSRNLIQYIESSQVSNYANPTTYPTSWFSTKISGSFNWASNSWNVLSAPNWVQASEEIIKYCMDPRNFLTEEKIFQFEDQTYYNASLSEVEQVFKNVSGSTFWTQTAEETGIVSPEGKKMTYAEAVYEIGNLIGMNPVILASRIVQEQGIGASPLISGNKTFTITKGADQGKVIACENNENLHYYNYFNMEATDGKEANYELIYNSGLTEAYYGTDGDPWDTRYKALYYGSQKLYNNYIAREQKNFYFQKFNVNSSKSGCLWRQYMQSVLTPQYEGKKAYSSYVSNGTVGSKHLFILPVFLEMPEEACAEPTKDGNPNYKIGSIYVNGKSLEGFSTDKLNYSMTVTNDVTTLHFNVHAYASTSLIKIGSLSEKGDLSGDVNVMIGDNTFKIVCKAENGTKRTYTLKVYREGEVIYGDVNGDKVWDIKDVAFIGSHITGKITLTGPALDAADINGDGKVDVVDVAFLGAYITDRIKEVPQRNKVDEGIE